MTKISKDKQYSVCGKRVRIICTDRKGSRYPVIGLVEDGGREYIELFDTHGKTVVQLSEEGSSQHHVRGDCDDIINNLIIPPGYKENGAVFVGDEEHLGGYCVPDTFLLRKYAGMDPKTGQHYAYSGLSMDTILKWKHCIPKEAYDGC